MSIKKSLSIIFGSFIFSLLILLALVLFINPREAGVFGLIVFFIALFSTFLSFFSLVFIIFKIRKSKEPEKTFEEFTPAFRKAILISLFFIAMILFRILKILNWWTGVLSALFLIFLELILSRRRKKIIYK